MPFTVTEIVFGAVLPLIVTWVLVVLAGCTLSSRLRRLAAPLAWIAGLHVGYWSLGLGPAAAEAHWHWIPYVISAAAVLSIVVALWFHGSRGDGRIWASVCFFAFAAACGYLIIPTWESLQPSRNVYMFVWPLLATAVFYYASSAVRRGRAAAGDSSETNVSALPNATALADSGTAGADARDALSHRNLAILSWLIFAALSIVLLLSGSLRFSQMALSMSAASAGLFLASLMRPRHVEYGLTLFPIVLALCSLLFIGKINSFSKVPLASYLLLPVAWVGLEAAILARTRDWPAWSQTLSVVVVAALIAACSVGLAAWYVYGPSAT
ncbi:hypothetical protein [Aureliella helgolandensis]|uniref:Uncharacterized protein n=1 Tax=Aureliella helgolandensis TaxID=2527968 RepID=A0A518G137_9BACT|nr:hypothetical protein [Aureliella helgolandensis]QDV22318.1 hypothetical protein Q31a_06020 [Aureliella helgolandensis]